MNVQITAQFDNQDMADFAVVRLRRNGVAFDIMDISVKNDDIQRDTSFPGSLVNIIYPYPSVGSRNYLGPESTSLIGSRAILSNSGAVSRDFGADYGISDEARLTISLDESQSEKAVQIIRSSYGYGVKVVG